MEGILKISEAANLGIHAMVCLLGADPTRTVSVAEIATRMQVSRDHLGKVLQRLAKVGLVTSRRGPKGGFALSEQARGASLLRVIEAIDGPLTTSTCLLGRPICGGDSCIMGGLMKSLHKQVHDYLSSTTLGEMAALSPLPALFAPGKK